MKRTIITKAIIEVRVTDLFTFLEERGYLESFLIAYSNYNLGVTLEKFYKALNPTSWLSVAFIWSDSKEGHDTWHKLEKEWKEYLMEGLSSEDRKNISWKIVKEKKIKEED